ncbi:allophanate hydrolase [Paenibacillus sp. y28]|uniref:allophanate hydrolase n=1 Tax=Paenibacillus sp. y28 TaxID=3129110 RepID=UPI0030189CF6
MNKTIIPQELSLAWLREQYAHCRLTPSDVMATIIERTQQDHAMNIWITPPSLQFIQPYLDRLADQDPASLPLWGIPFAVKDNIDVAGLPTTAACAEYTYVPGDHAAVVERLIAAGAIPVGKTNLDQFATGLVGIRSPYGETHNALRPELISGGSSSGSAVAVARGHAAFSLGTDTAGSGRVPAALNRLIGYKPSLGAWSTKGVVPACASLDCVTVFARHLDDALAVDAVARGAHDGDPWSRAMAPPASKLPVKLCLPKEEPEFYGPFAEAYRSAWASAVERIQALSIPVETVDYTLFSEAAAILYEGPWVAERWAAVGGFIAANPGVAYPVTEQILRSGADGRFDAVSVFEAMHRLQDMKRKARKLLQDAVLIMPTAGGTWTREQARQEPVAANREMGRYTNHCNLLDLCAVAVPAGDAAAETPFGITLFALAENEGLLSGAAALFLNPASARPEPVYPMRDVLPAARSTTTYIAVCGLHMRGYPLEKQLLACGARFVREAASAASYKFVKLPGLPAKPGMVKQEHGGASIQLEVWEMPLENFGAFAASIPAPLGIGKVELEDGSEIPGFICEAYAAGMAEDISALGSWRRVEGV